MAPPCGLFGGGSLSESVARSGCGKAEAVVSALAVVVVEAAAAEVVAGVEAAAVAGLLRGPTGNN